MEKKNPDSPNQDIRSASQEHEIRVAKAHELREKGIEPWPEGKDVSHVAQDIIDGYSDGTEEKFAIAGRIMAKRGHGKSIFAVLQDRSGRVQLYFKADVLGPESFEIADHYADIGDVMWVKGTPFKTKMGEITLRVEECAIIGKCLHPLPEKFHGIADVEVKYRQRYLDLMSSEESRNKFIKRSKIVSSLRSFLDSYEFMEVETPMLHPVPGGAAAKPFVTHHNTFDMDLYLRIAPELYLKRLVVGGLERVYEINRNFRNEGVSTRHNPEFTMLEFYWAHQNYDGMMDFVEEMLRDAAQKACGTLQLKYGEYDLDFSKPFDRISIKDAVLKYGNYSEADIEGDKIDAEIKKHGAKLQVKDASWGQKLYTLFEEIAEKHIVQPTFVTDFPVEVSPLSKRDPENPAFVRRFELMVGGMELANAFNELNDPFDQKERFEQQAKTHASGDPEAHRYDDDYIRAVEYAFPPTMGCGIGIDRLTMLLTNTTSIKDVILFPTLKHK